MAIPCIRMDLVARRSLWLVSEKEEAGTVVGEFNAVHEGDLLVSYHLVSGEGDGR